MSGRTWNYRCFPWVTTNCEKNELITTTHHGERHFLHYLVKVVVPLGHLRLPRCEMRADETERRAVQEEANGHAPFVTGCPAHTRLGRINSHVSESRRNET